MLHIGNEFTKKWELTIVPNQILRSLNDDKTVFVITSFNDTYRLTFRNVSQIGSMIKDLQVKDHSVVFCEWEKMNSEYDDCYDSHNREITYNDLEMEIE